MSSPREPLGRRAEARIRRRHLDIVVFGPGRSHVAGWDLRQRLRSRAADENPGDVVEFPEDVIMQSEALQELAETELLLAEMAIVHECDAVIALIINDPLASGVLVELGQFLADRELHERFLVLIPAELYALVMSGQAPYALHILRTLPRDHLISYNTGDGIETAEVWARIRQWIFRLRGRRAFLRAGTSR